METTYGSPDYEFPPTAKLVRDVNDLVGEMYHRGRPVVLMGYPLGKAQLLTYYFSNWEPIYFHRNVWEMNRVHSKHGVRLKEGRVFDPSKDVNSMPPGPWLMVAPMSSTRNGTISELRRRYNAVSMAFSGWALGSQYSRMLGADFAFPLSDHCDYSELLTLVEKVSPELVYTTHGFAKEFAHDLRGRGFAARPLGAYQSSLQEYAH
jgi:putative mRNA 3-end processing factor